jgi:hypothetical protein
MRRFWIMVAAVLACGGLAAQTSVAYADAGSSRSASASCTDLVKRYQKVNSAQAHTDLNNPKSLSALFRQGAKALNQLASTGPSQLRSAFRHLAQGFAQLAKVDFSNPSSYTQLSGFGAQYGEDLKKIAAYFSQKCNFTIPTS